jgi:hypothetical protein
MHHISKTCCFIIDWSSTFLLSSRSIAFQSSMYIYKCHLIQFRWKVWIGAVNGDVKCPVMTNVWNIWLFLMIPVKAMITLASHYIYGNPRISPSVACEEKRLTRKVHTRRLITHAINQAPQADILVHYNMWLVRIILHTIG